VKLRSGSTVLHVKWEGLWWSVNKYSSYEFQRADVLDNESRRLERSKINYPEVSII
jgi:hypothetical protein